eukprot:1510778-Karenia_brevis.AAC.1
MHLVLAKLDIVVWWEHVDSQANIADDGTREGPNAQIYKELHIPMQEVSFPVWPTALQSAPL